MAQQIQQKSAKKVNLNNFLVGTFLSFVTQPFEVLRTSSIINANHNQGTGFRSLKYQITNIWKTEGIQGFYRGGLLATIKSTASCGIFFTGLENIKNIFNTENQQSQIIKQTYNFLSACTAKFITTSTLCPINVLKTRFEIAGQQEYMSIFKTIKLISKEEGLYGFYRGIMPTLLRDINWSGVQYVLYNMCLNSYQNLVQENPQQNHSFIFISGAFSSGLSLLIVYPFDNIRVRYQGTKKESRSFSKMLQYIYYDQGVIGFYKGYLPRLLKKCISGALLWSIYEKLNYKNDSIQIKI
ncbi:mitochondrial carrier protein, putative [Ichthyophthirius multifiliis]|uniref:Mitochondrial carrier protein, putative n=1 Tax=Ichthyophthirius multifiliis TaxID=5932 RepID=G0QXB1_ICHMU|nr:mitochondrial carrier protein, putative [Ichthyophthirius multifiliis]EGR30142.1 mitochondrial carrier protein, putative [Ichthyophthirius multifiliis]|eukprot:XP_004031378.1 mitochondrial carrier protein, putative [Ichthyophthirius multifiliis]